MATKKSIFDNLEINAFRAGITPRTKESIDWFKQKASKLSSINRDKLLKDSKLKQSPFETMGGMYFFFYDPKYKETLPYYDAFPLIINMGPAKGENGVFNGFYGLNLHYLPPILRAKFLKNLIDIQSKPLTENARFQVTYDTLKSMSKLRYFKPCFKHYLNKHVKSHFAEVKVPEWEIATFLPCAAWRKRHRQKVYYDSRNMI